ncbi:hypothetical protein Tco_0733045 [Tanacetum coccineum]
MKIDQASIVENKSMLWPKEFKKSSRDEENLRGDPNHLIGECSKSPKNNDQRAFIRGAWSDNGEDEVGKTKDKTCLVAQAPDEICLGVNLEPDEWIKDSDASRTHIGLWYPKGSGIETIVYADSDHVGDYVDRKALWMFATFIGMLSNIVFSKKQTALTISTTEAEYVSAGKACQQALWMKQALIDYGVSEIISVIAFDFKLKIVALFPISLNSVESLIETISIRISKSVPCYPPHEQQIQSSNVILIEFL